MSGFLLGPEIDPRVWKYLKKKHQIHDPKRRQDWLVQKAPTGNYKKLALHTIQPLGPDFMMLFPDEILMIFVFFFNEDSWWKRVSLARSIYVCI